MFYFYVIDLYVIVPEYTGGIYCEKTIKNTACHHYLSVLMILTITNFTNVSEKPAVM